MTLIDIVLVAIGLAMDAFAVSLAAGTSAHLRGVRPAFRLSFHLGLFQFMMPVLGWIGGVNLAGLVSSVAPWIAFALLVVVGARMVRSGLGHERGTTGGDPTRGLTLVGLSLATSIDAFAVGVSLAMIGVDIWYPSVVIGIITGALSLVGIRLGRWLGAGLKKRMEVAGGLILIGIGVRILIVRG